MREDHEHRLPRVHDDAPGAVRHDRVRQRREVDQRQVERARGDPRRRHGLVLVLLDAHAVAPRLVPQPPRDGQVQEAAVPADAQRPGGRPLFADPFGQRGDAGEHGAGFGDDVRAQRRRHAAGGGSDEQQAADRALDPPQQPGQHGLETRSTRTARVKLRVSATSACR
ncbi:hypothetical protein MUY22_28905 [Amycolatopsis sp. WQ 127309]|nr:hypothetical protein [Amycolatopsis sp. WQ 127309]UOZ12057.1 hypothetical protein MUY22_28905 [Amycolatopsis sp. WQ 127309]